MAIDLDTMQWILDRALDDADFLKRLVQDPEGTARSQGFELSGEDADAIRKLSGASETEIVETLKARISYAAGFARGRN